VTSAATPSFVSCSVTSIVVEPLAFSSQPAPIEDPKRDRPELKDNPVAVEAGLPGGPHATLAGFDAMSSQVMETGPPPGATTGHMVLAGCWFGFLATRQDAALRVPPSSVATPDANVPNSAAISDPVALPKSPENVTLNSVNSSGTLNASPASALSRRGQITRIALGPMRSVW
jgi:hypothetical protein